MGLTLRIENQTSLPDGGPLSYSIEGKRGIDIGRDQYLDWTLPDPSRFISGKHCEVRWHDGGYWLHDISRNGTFLDGADSRLKEAHRLRNGDRFSIGHYIIVATIDGEGDGERSGDGPGTPSPHAASYDDLWNPVGEAAPPIDPKQLKAARDLQPVRPDFLNWAVDVPDPYPSSSSPPPSESRRTGREAGSWDASPAPAVDDWAQGTPRPSPPPPEIIPVPNPRRPVWVSHEPEGPWAAEPAAARPAAPPPASPEAAANALPAAQAFAATSRSLPSISAIENAAMTDFVRLFARGAGLPEDAFAARNPAELAEQLGQLMRLVAENVKQLLEARQM